MSKVEDKQVVCELKDGGHVEGVLVNIDKINLKIMLSKVKKSHKENPQDVQHFDNLEINKDDIKELKLIQYEAKDNSKEININTNAIPENKIPSQYQLQQQNKSKSYNKEESFFDNLNGMTHQEAKKESKNYNNRNKDTFQLNDNKNNNYNHNGYYQKHHRGNNRGGRGRYRGSNRGRGRGYNNNNIGYSNNNNNHYISNNNNKPNQRRGGYNRRGMRGSNNYITTNNNTFYKRNNYNKGNSHYQQHNMNNKQHQNNINPELLSKLQAYKPEGVVQPVIEKSIYEN